MLRALTGSERSIRFQSHSKGIDPVIAVGGEISIGLLGDWGNGRSEATATARQMEARPDCTDSSGLTGYYSARDEEAGFARHGLSVGIGSLTFALNLTTRCKRAERTTSDWDLETLASSKGRELSYFGLSIGLARRGLDSAYLVKGSCIWMISGRKKPTSRARSQTRYIAGDRTDSPARNTSIIIMSTYQPCM